MLQGSFEGIEAKRWLWLGPSKTRFFRYLFEFSVPARLAMVRECMSNQAIAWMALGVPLTEQDNAVRMAYFSNTSLMERHLRIAEKIMLLLYRTTQFYESPEPLPLVFYNALIPGQTGRTTEDYTYIMARFLKASIETQSDASPHLFCLIIRVLSESAEHVEQKWLQPCTEAVALQIWLDPNHPCNRTAVNPYHAGKDSPVTEMAIRWFDLCPVLFQRFQSKYNIRFTTHRRKRVPGGGELVVRVDTKLFQHLLQEDTTGFVWPTFARHGILLRRWLTLWTFYCLGQLTEENRTHIHEMVHSARLICTPK